MLKIKNLNYYNLSQNILVILLLISFWSALVYRVYALNHLGIIISLILVIISYNILQYYIKKFNAPPSLKLRRTSPLLQEQITENSTTNTDKSEMIIDRILTSFYIISIIVDFLLLYLNSTHKSIISPWELLPGYFFLIYFIASLLLLFIFTKRTKNRSCLIALHLFLSISVIWIIYRLGYGYDYFVHSATLDLIDKNGLVNPKPNYYLGQYGLLIILHKFSRLPIYWLNLILVPLLAVIFLPITLFKILGDQLQQTSVGLTALLLFVLPFSILTFTTPQNFAYLLLLLIIIYALNWHDNSNYFIIGLLSLTTLTIHPVVGLPALFFFVLISIYKFGIKLKKYLQTLIFFLTALALPASFYLLDKNNFNISKINFNDLFSLPKFVLPGQDNVILNAVYLHGFNLSGLITLLITVGLIIYYKNKKEYPAYKPFLVIAPALLLSYVLVKLLPFNYLINYERSDYADRILTVAVIFFLPFVLLCLSTMANRIMTAEKYVRIGWLFIIALLMSTSFYLSYPRYDQFFNSHGYSVGNFDLEAVNYIKNNTNNDYIVLANQQVSAAALRQFGFNKYYKNNQIFYYPVPTSGPLYQYYLDMVYKKPSRETINKAMDLAGVNEAYFVLNKYWYASPKILEEAKLIADSWQSIGAGEVYVFKFSK